MSTGDVILVDENDREIGTLEKLVAHKEGKLHRAFSVFVFHPDGRLLIQKRAEGKYHSGGLWTNTCCSHPRPGESVLESAHKRLQEEMGFDCELSEVHAFVYRVELQNGLIEHEYDHVLFGVWSGNPKVNPEEASEWKFMSLEELKVDIALYPERYTFWLRVSLDEVIRLAQNLLRDEKPKADWLS
jgi:isopentenyl-diphosphate delta-isomerase